MKNTKNVITLLLSIGLFLNNQLCILGQTNPDILPKSPTAAELGKYVDVPVSLYTGIPSIDIPLYTIAEKGVNIPISLSYHAGGIKVEEVSSWVGLGWSLQATGVINRTVKGVVDNSSALLPENWYKNKYSSFVNSSLNPEVEADYKLLCSIANGKTDAAPDIYSFSFLGYSGKFIITDKITCIPLQPFKIVPISSIEDPTGFQITTNDGIVYTFSDTESIRIKNETITYTTSYYLSSIKLTNGNIIEFTYTDFTQNNRSIGYSESAYYEKPSPYGIPGINFEQKGSITTTINSVTTYGKTLSKIKFLNGSVEFVTQSDRQDFSESRLDKLLVKDKLGTIIKKVKFNNNYYFDAGNIYNKRLKLVSIDELVPNQEQEIIGAKHSFTYEESVNLPERNSKSIDHWGYYNGKNNLTLIPDLLNAESCEGLLDLTKREPNENYAIANILKKVTYPTGGSSFFEYELNDYGVNEVEDTKSSKTLEVVTGQTLEKPFSIVNNPSSCAEIVTDIYRPSAEEAGATKICEVKLFKIDSNNQRQLIVGYNSSQSNGNHTISLGNGQYVLTGSCNITGAYAKATVNYYSDRTYAYKKKIGGLRVKKVSLSDGSNSSNNIVRTYSYTSNDDVTKSSGVRFSFPEYANLGYGFKPTGGDTEFGSSNISCGGYEIESLSLSSGTIINYGADNIVGYKEVTTHYQSLTKTFIQKDFFSTEEYSFQDSDNSWQKGRLQKQLFYNSDKKLVSESNLSYKALPLNSTNTIYSEVFWGLKVRYSFIHPCGSPDFLNINYPRRFVQLPIRNFTEIQVLNKKGDISY